MSEETEVKELISELMTGAFKGDYPEIPLPADLNAVELGGMFVTLPVAKVGAKSRNGYVYSKKAVEDIANRINSKRPEGRWGHLKPSERESRYDPPAVRWLVSQLAPDGTLWAKGVPITPDSKEHFRVAKLTGADAGTSIYGIATFKGQQVVGFELETIDLADPTRAGLLEAVAPPRITSEMSNETEVETVDESQFTQRIQELTIENEGDKRLIAELTQAVDTQKVLIQELCQVAGVEKPEEIKGVVAEFINARNKAVETARQAVAEQVVAAEISKLPTTAKYVLKALGTPDTDDKDAIKTRVAELMQTPEIKEIAEMERFKLGGGRAIVGEQAPTNGGFREEAIANAANHAASIGIQVKK